MHLPSRCEQHIVAVVQTCTPTMPSPSASFMAILPLLLMLTKSDSSLRARHGLGGKDDVLLLPLRLVFRQRQDGGDAFALESGSRFTMALPLPAMRASGNRQTLSL